MAETREVRGTREWSVASQNICTGCEHRCRYCYAAFDAVTRHRLPDYDAWGTMSVRRKTIDGTVKRVRGGSVMFPTTHDITPSILDDCMTIIHKHLKIGNDLLIVTKPHLECIERICGECAGAIDQILFRFTICAFDDDILQLWEPGAPTYAERYASLLYARAHGFQTSISCEPMLDSDNVAELFYRQYRCITHSFWIGKMNHIRDRVQPDIPEAEIKRIEAGQTDKRIRKIYEQLKNEPLIRWKESFRKVLELPLMACAGQDK